MKTLPICMLALAMLLTAVPAPADVAPDPLNQGVTPARRDSRVQMVSQDVIIRLGGDWCLVEADFLLHNRSKAPAAMEVGFPTGYRDEVKGLKVWRNGQPVETKKSIEQEITEPDRDPITYHWTLWNMRFAPGEKTRLLVSYRVKPRKNHDYLITPYRRSLDRIREDAADRKPMPPEVRRIIDGMVSYSTGYIMVTGAGWYDPIEKATVTVRHPKGAGAVRWLEPSNRFTSSAEGIEWRFEFIKPDFDIKVEFSDTWTIEDEIAAVEKAAGTAGKNQGLNDHLRFLKKMKKCLASGNCGE
ncbi:MAG TPA: hypothetical protein PK587_10525 [Syntrophales bacterium]|nr:hypothetical protein [Syntrophales bacterium]